MNDDDVTLINDRLTFPLVNLHYLKNYFSVNLPNAINCEI